MKNVNYVSQFTRYLVREGLLKKAPLQVADVGARSGPQSHWPLYGDQVNVIGFEPYKDESDSLNKQAKAGAFHVPFVCYPIALGNADSTARLYEYPNKAANSLTPPAGGASTPYTDITIKRFDHFAAEHTISRIDFMKIDVERHEVSVLEGLGKFLDADGILGFEVEVHFQPSGDAPMLSDIELILRKYGYRLYDVDIFRASSPLLPSPVAWDHRDHNNQPILGPTVQGRMVHGDALFFKDLAPEKAEIMRKNDSSRILKMASLYEVYGFSDCAIELLEEYRTLINPLVPVDALRNALVPEYYGKDLSYEQYLQAYKEHVGRVPGQLQQQEAAAEPPSTYKRVLNRIKRLKNEAA